MLLESYFSNTDQFRQIEHFTVSTFHTIIFLSMNMIHLGLVFIFIIFSVYLHHTSILKWSSPGGASSKETPCQCRRFKRLGFNPWVRKIPRRKEWLPTPVFLPGEFHGQRSLQGYSPWSRTESDTTEMTRQQQQHALVKPQSVLQIHHLQKFPFTPLFFCVRQRHLK